VLNVRLYIQVNILTSVADELIARHSQDLTLCQAKVNEFQISETKYESLFDETITTIKKREKTLIDGITKHSQKLQNLKFKSDIIFLDFVAVVNIVLPWIDFKAAMISSWWSIIVFSAWSACLFKSQNV
jgi:hypothetical protein